MLEASLRKVFDLGNSRNSANACRWNHTGGYFGEDDIERLEDDYERTIEERSDVTM